MTEAELKTPPAELEVAHLCGFLQSEGCKDSLSVLRRLIFERDCLKSGVQLTREDVDFLKQNLKRLYDQTKTEADLTNRVLLFRMLQVVDHK